jgi:cytochrome c-type biogenesis protein CcmH/NrfG
LGAAYERQGDYRQAALAYRRSIDLAGGSGSDSAMVELKSRAERQLGVVETQD